MTAIFNDRTMLNDESNLDVYFSLTLKTNDGDVSDLSPYSISLNDFVFQALGIFNCLEMNILNFRRT